jgi:uncharacterized protein YciI
MTEIFTVEYSYPDDTTLQDEHRPAHLAYLRERLAQGELLLSGPWGDDEAPGGLLVYGVADRARIEEIVANDPFVVNEVVATKRVHSWRPIVGPASAAFAV